MTEEQINAAVRLHMKKIGGWGTETQKKLHGDKYGEEMSRRRKMRGVDKSLKDS